MKPALNVKRKDYGHLEENVADIKSKHHSNKSAVDCKYIGLSLIFVLVISVAALLITLWTYSPSFLRNPDPIPAYDSFSVFNPQPLPECDIRLVESIPIGLNFTPNNPAFLSTYEAWKSLLDSAITSLDIASLYWSLRGVDVINHTSAAPGEDIFQRMLSNGIDNKLKIRIVQSTPTDISPDWDTEILKNYGAAEVVSLDFPKYLGGGVLHTKLWIVDNKHFYLGSANMDWRSLTQVKELGVLAQNCPTLTEDIAKIFQQYWYLGSDPKAQIPREWPERYQTHSNHDSPMLIQYNKNYAMPTYLSSSPPPLSAIGRTHDLDAILQTINESTSFINIAVMDYFPLMIYSPSIQYWPYIDNALRKAAIERKIAIKMLISWWKHSNPSEDYFLRSLKDLNDSVKGVNIQIRRFVVPENDDQSKIPYARVNHNKYMVTDSIAYIGTSNWSGDYFTNTAGIGLVLKETVASAQNRTLRTDLLQVFQRDWDSPYAYQF